jgi:hypothetical protein
VGGALSNGTRGDANPRRFRSDQMRSAEPTRAGR